MPRSEAKVGGARPGFPVRPTGRRSMPRSGAKAGRPIRLPMDTVEDAGGTGARRSLPVSAGAVLGVDAPRDRAMPYVGPVPQAEPLPAAEERGRFVVDHRDRHLGTVAGAQSPLVVPAQLGREVSDVTGLVQAMGMDHQGVGVIAVLLPARLPRDRVECDERPVPNLPHRDHLSWSGHLCSHAACFCVSHDTLGDLRTSGRSPPDSANTRLARKSAGSSRMRSSLPSVPGAAASRLACRRRARSRALRTLRAFANLGWAIRRARYSRNTMAASSDSRYR